ncbi:MAG: prepilin-type N-terminal cleavage/methylation domain-containing protein [Acidobacteriota bacterium]
MERRAAAPRRRAERGLTLAELLIASFILLVILLGIVPLFTKATFNNVHGRNASEVASWSRQNLEQLSSRTLNSTDMRAQAALAGPVFARFLDTGPQQPNGVDERLGDERWVEDNTGADHVKWASQVRLQAYDFSDVHFGTIGIATVDGDGNPVEPGLITQGNNALYDSPLPEAQIQTRGGAHLRSFDTFIQAGEIVLDVDGNPIVSPNPNQRVRIQHLRAF